MSLVPRRTVITGIPAAAAVIGLAACTPTPAGSSGADGAGGSSQPLRFFSSHQAAVVADATARIAPGPGDDPAEAGHPGARETGVTGYIDALLGALPALEAAGPGGGGRAAPVLVIFAGGPWSNR